MGIIQRQSIKHSIVTYIGVALSAISTIFIYPHAYEAYGLVQFLFKTVNIIVPLVLLGTTVITVKYFPEFRTADNKHNGFIGFMVLIALFGFLLFSAAFPLIKPWLNESFQKNSSQEWSQVFIYYVLPLTLITALVRLFALYASNFRRIVIPVILEEFLIRLSLPALILLFYFQYISIGSLVNGVVLTYLVALIGLLIYVNHLGHLSLIPNFSILKKSKAKEIANYGGFGVITGLGTRIAFDLDVFMIGMYLNVGYVGVYGLMLFMSDALSKPIRSIIGIAQPIISDAFQKGDMEEIEGIYKKSSLNLIVLGVFLFLLLWLSLDDVFLLMANSEKMAEGKYVVFWLVMAKLFNMATSVNNEIINYSKYYRFNFVAVMLLAILNVVTNMLLIPEYQMIGAAIATFVSLSLFNLVKLIFIKMKFNIQPITFNMLKVFGIGILAYFLILLVPDTGYVIPNIILKSVVASLIYLPTIYKLKISEEFNGLVRKYIPKI